MMPGDVVRFWYLGRIERDESGAPFRVLESCEATVVEVFPDDVLTLSVAWPEQLGFSELQSYVPLATTDPPASGSWSP